MNTCRAFICVLQSFFGLANATLAVLSLCAIPPAQGSVAELTGKPVVGRNADGQLEVFTVTTDGVLRHRRQNPANGDWSAWLGLAGDLLPGIGIDNNSSGEIQVFGVDRTNGSLWTIHQQGSNSANWSEWRNLGGLVQPPVTVTHTVDGRLEVFAVSTYGIVQHLWQPNRQGDWSDWASLGQIKGGIAPQLAVAKNQDGRLELFGTTSNNTVVHSWQRGAGVEDGWSAWTDLGGSVLPGIVVARNARGLVEVFGVNSTNSAVNRCCQSAPGSSREWRNWEYFGGRVKPGLAVQQSVGQNEFRLELWAVNADDSILTHRWETMLDGSDQWSQWEKAGQAAEPYPAVGQNEDGNLEVFGVDAEDPETIMLRRQISSSSGWLEWMSLDHRTVEYNSRRWQVDEGLPDNVVQALAQTRDGYLWVGTQNGLAKFDGVTFTVYNSINRPELKNSSITALRADRTGGLWIGMDGGGLGYLSDSHFEQFTETNGLAGNKIRAIYQTKDDSIWIGTTTGLTHMNRAASGHPGKSAEHAVSGTNSRFSTLNYKVRDGLLSEVVSHLCEDRDGNLWIATGKGLNRLRSDGGMDAFTMPNALPNDAVRGICQDRGGQVWIGSNNGLLWYNSFWRSFYAYNTRYGLSDRFVSAICEDREGNLWVGTYSGLNRFNQGRLYNVTDNEGLPFDRVNALLEDREGDVWVGSREGLVRLTPKRFSTITRRQGLSHDNVTSVMQDRDGSLWIGTWGGGVNQIKDDKVVPQVVTNIPGKNVVLSPPQSPFWKGSDVPISSQSPGLVLSLCEGHDGSLWIGADFDGGLTRLKDGAVTRYNWKEGFTNGGLRALHEDRGGNLWIGANRALCRLTKGKLTRFTAQDGFDGQAVRAICEDREGDLWFGTDSGLRHWHEGKFNSYTTNEGLSANRVLSLYNDEQDNVWIGTEGGGLNRISRQPAGRADTPNLFSLRSYTTKQGLFSDEIFGILEDAGWLWMSCSKGVFRVSMRNLDQLLEGKVENLTCIAYGKADGMESPQCNGMAQPAAWKTRDGMLWFATIKGVVKADPRTIKMDRSGPAVFITGVIADQKQIEDSGWTVQSGNGEQGLLRDHSSPPVKIPPGRGELEFDYTALNLSAPEKSRFQYKLEGVNSHWVDAGAHRVAHYNSVPPGKYNFRVRACNKDGIWSEAGAQLALVYLPHFWQAWWFAGLLLAGFIGGTAVAVRYVTRRKLQGQLALAEQRHAIERERGRIAKDIHDDLGASLTRIMMLGHSTEDGLNRREDVSARVQKIVYYARSTVQSLDEIVWAINPQNDTLDGLVAYIGHYADELFENSNIHCRLEIPLELPALSLPADTRHNLFLAIKEAFHNVLKHSGGSEARLRISATPEVLQIDIEDNGCGFDPNNGQVAGRKGNGLENMRKRISHLDGDLEVISSPRKGTRLTFRIRSQVAARIGER